MFQNYVFSVNSSKYIIHGTCEFVKLNDFARFGSHVWTNIPRFDLTILRGHSLPFVLCLPSDALSKMRSS